MVAGGGRDSYGVRGGHVHTAVFKMDNQQGPTAQHRELCSVFCSSLEGSGGLGEMDACVCMTESFHSSLETITTLFVNQLYPNRGFPSGPVVKNPPAMKETQEM